MPCIATNKSCVNTNSLHYNIKQVAEVMFNLGKTFGLNYEYFSLQMAYMHAMQ